MRLCEITQPSDPETVLDAYELIRNFVTLGELRTLDQFDTDFDRLMTLLPRPSEPVHAFRVLSLPTSSLNRITAARGLKLRPHRYSSWTKDAKAVTRLLRNRRATADPATHSVVVVKRDFAGSQIVVDIAAFYHAHRLRGAYEWKKYVAWEQEIIVYDETPLVLHPADLVNLR